MKALVITEPGRFEVQEVATPEPGPYQALMKVETMALCNATDRKLVEGHFPGMETYPMVLGHENAGIVEKVGEKATCFKVGDRVLGGMVFDFGVPGLVGGWGGFSARPQASRRCCTPTVWKPSTAYAQSYTTPTVLRHT